MSTLVYGLIEGGHRGFTHPTVVAALAIAVITLAASAVFNTFRQVGGAVAIAVFGALIANPDTFLTGLRVSLGSAAALLLLAAVNSTRIQPRG
ncbi:hypothetical protein [Kribbella sp. NPDC051620]|uniref:hypothetical protein n=1 Tax=Kribbella sp. NPDC051620 TaxID=3364120 RepID=UPI00379AC6D6